MESIQVQIKTIRFPNKSHWRGKKHRPESIQKMRAHSSWNKGLKLSVEHKKKLAEAKVGEKHPNWKGGISPLNKRVRVTSEYRNWRESVFKRDNHTCKGCGLRGVYIEAHHIKPFAFFPELRFVLSNGVTLCRRCHSKTDSYKGRGSRKYKNGTHTGTKDNSSGQS